MASHIYICQYYFKALNIGRPLYIHGQNTTRSWNRHSKLQKCFLSYLLTVEKPLHGKFKRTIINFNKCVIRKVGKFLSFLVALPKHNVFCIMWKLSKNTIASLLCRAASRHRRPLCGCGTIFLKSRFGWQHRQMGLNKFILNWYRSTESWSLYSPTQENCYWYYVPYRDLLSFKNFGVTFFCYQG